MICERCQSKAATVRVYLQQGSHRQEIFLCQDCFAETVQGKAGGGEVPGGLFYGSSAGGSAGAGGPEGGPFAGTATAAKGGQAGLLDQLGVNLTDMARAGKIDGVIGRDREINRTIEVLNRRQKNNPVLVGEAGVGKTAIAEGLAKRIASGDVPAKLADKQIYSVDVAGLVSGTGYRGQFEERVRKLVAEVEARPEVILFMDEIHLIVGAGSAEGSMDAANILKPSLARGSIRLIGATTLDEYRRIEKDAALERRFQPVRVEEPSLQDAVEILRGVRPQYEKYHEVAIPDEAVQACVTLSRRYIQDRFLPDKAIDLLDEAGARLNLRRSDADADSLEQRLREARQKKLESTKAERYEEAAKWRDRETELTRLMGEKKEAERPVLTVEDVASIVEEKTGIPVRRLEQAERERLKGLGDALSSRVIGQGRAVNAVARAIRRGRAGLNDASRPIASFLFVGPTGVGKTELAKSLARELFGDEQAMVRFDMSEYMERHTVAKLIGAPPGYVGHDRAGQLTERVRRRPYSIVLLDEIEKAHPDVQNVFLQILEDGRLTDSQGRTVSFRDTVIIMTSNAGALDRKPRLGFSAGGDASSREDDRLEWDRVLRGYFRPEFLNRIDAVVPFDPLTQDDLLRIVERMTADVRERVEARGLRLTVSEAAKRWLAARGYDPAYGARPLRRAVQVHVEDGIAEALLESDGATEVRVDAEGDGLVVQAS